MRADLSETARAALDDAALGARDETLRKAARFVAERKS